jgi:DNA topoisomerase-1
MATTLYDALSSADDAGLLYVTDDIPGIRRRRCGRGFTYIGPGGERVTDRDELARVKGIVVPPAWQDVWICPVADGHILAVGRDSRGRKQYRYHPRWRQVRDATKFGELHTFGSELAVLRRRVDADLRRRGLPREKVLALVVRLLDETLVRVGNAEYADANETYGLTTLRTEHVEVRATTVRFDFVGKGGTEREVALRDRRLARIVRECHELGGQELFGYLDETGDVARIGSQDVNDYLRSISGRDTTAKVFRTWGGTVTAAETLVALGPPGTSGNGTGAADDREIERDVLEAVDRAAHVLGNTRAVCRSSYVHPDVLDAHRNGELARAWRSSRATEEMRRAERTVLRVLGPGG